MLPRLYIVKCHNKEIEVFEKGNRELFDISMMSLDV